MHIRGEKCIEHNEVGHEPAMHITELCIYALIQSWFSFKKPRFKQDHSVLMQLSELCTYPMCI